MENKKDAAAQAAAPQPPQGTIQPTQQKPTLQPSQWQGAQQEQPAPAQAANGTVKWTAAEYVEHNKTSMWYALFAGATVGVTIVIYIITKEILATLVILVTGGSVAFFANRPPTSRNYEISHEGIKIDDKHYSLEDFKSFSVVEEGVKDSIWLQPVKRIMPFIIIYFSPQDEDRIVNVLGALLPHEPRELDHLDRLTKKLRF